MMTADLLPLDAVEEKTIDKPDAEKLTFSSIIAALSFALDLTEGATPGHALRTCLIGMRLGQHYGLKDTQLSDLYYALLLKDAGCSSNATRLHQIIGDDEIHAKNFTRTTDWTRFEWRQVRFLFQHVHHRARLGERVKAIRSMLNKSRENAEALIRLRCHQGATVVMDLGLSKGTAEAIYALDEHWDGSGYPDRLSGERIPVLARIVSLAQTLEIFNSHYGPRAALDVMQRRSGRWFDPAVVRAALALIRTNLLFQDLDSSRLKEIVAAHEPRAQSLHPDAATIDNICVAFAGVIDAKSHSTYMHSTRVARIAVALGAHLGLQEHELITLRRAGLLHDIGKLSIPNSILDKAGKLDDSEWAAIRMHTFFTYEILSRIPTFDEIADIAASHHEKLDGSGYFRGTQGAELPLMARILTVADMYEALSAERTYRANLSKEQVLNILREDVPHALDAHCFAALEDLLAEPNGLNLED